MKVLLQGRPDLFRRVGGDSDLIQNLYTHLSKNKIYCQINATGKMNFSKFDIIHFFGIMRIQDLYSHFLRAKKQHKKIIVTPIYEDLSLLDRYGRIGWERFFINILPNDLKELAKGLLRGVKDNRQLKSAFLQFLVPYSKQQKTLLLSADHIIATSCEEMNSLIKNFALPKSKVSFVPIGIDPKISKGNKDKFVTKYKLKNFILCVGRIEPKKNQLGLIDALKNTKIPTVFIGSESPYHRSYVKMFLKKIGENPHIKYLGELDRSILLSAYSAAKVHVLVSWFEILGIANMEAALNNCNIVSTNKGYAREYFGDLAWYCSPQDGNSIKKAVINAYNSPFKTELKEKILKEYTWDKNVPKIQEVYKNILQK